MTEHLHRLLRYDMWANRETLDSLEQSSTTPKSLRWMAHIVAAEYLWLARLCRQPATMPVWPDLDVEGCSAGLGDISSRWMNYLADVRPERLAETIPYTNSKGESWTSTVEEVLTHVVIHSAYHRGQIAADLRGAGGTPASTDYIHAVRQGLIE